jgi:hypothetical protein
MIATMMHCWVCHLLPLCYRLQPQQLARSLQPMVQVICHALFTVAHELLLLRVSVFGHCYYCCSTLALKFLSLGTGDVILIEDSSSSDADDSVKRYSPPADGVVLIVGSCPPAAAATAPRYGTRPYIPFLAPAVYLSTCDSPSSLTCVLLMLH